MMGGVEIAKKMVIWADGGSGNMGDVTDEANIVARWPIVGSRHSIVRVRCHFASGTSTSAILSMKVDSHRTTGHDIVLDEFAERGTGGDDLNFRVPIDEMQHYTLEPGDFLVFEWTNPDSGNMTWGLEVAMVSLDDATD
jgi:hypothetical protein